MERRGTGTEAGTDLVYAPTARRFHWAVVGLVAIMIPLGFYMVWRGETTQFDATTGRLYDLHKLIGFIILWVMLARLVYRLRNGAPPDEPTLEWWQKAGAHLTHWGLYAMLIAMPIGGWIGVSLYGARGIFGLFSLPPLTGVDQDASATVFLLHKWGAILICLMIGAHVGAAIFHHFIRKDGVLRRMLPGLAKRS